MYVDISGTAASVYTLRLLITLRTITFWPLMGLVGNWETLIA